MENTNNPKNGPQNTGNIQPPVEHDYDSHKQNPGPAPEAVYEEDKKGAGSVLRWIIPILVIALLIFWLFFKK